MNLSHYLICYGYDPEMPEYIDPSTNKTITHTHTRDVTTTTGMFADIRKMVVSVGVITFAGAQNKEITCYFYQPCRFALTNSLGLTRYDRVAVLDIDQRPDLWGTACGYEIYKDQTLPFGFWNAD